MDWKWLSYRWKNHSLTHSLTLSRGNAQKQLPPCFRFPTQLFPFQPQQPLSTLPHSTESIVIVHQRFNKHWRQPTSHQTLFSLLEIFYWPSPVFETQKPIPLSELLSFSCTDWNHWWKFNVPQPRPRWHFLTAAWVFICQSVRGEQTRHSSVKRVFATHHGAELLNTHMIEWLKHSNY